MYVYTRTRVHVERCPHFRGCYMYSMELLCLYTTYMYMYICTSDTHCALCLAQIVKCALVTQMLDAAEHVVACD